jgi:rare lipoprotein A
MMGLAMSASAKDGSPTDTATLPSILKPTSTVNPIPIIKSNPTARPNPTARHTVRNRSKHWLEVGVASWYGGKFQGRKTAGGEIYDMYRMTCAHPSLPLGTWLRVTNMHNHKTTFVRVNDRGPVLEGRIVDLSFAAARVLGLEGIGRVKLESIEESDPDLAVALVAQLKMPDIYTIAGR